MLRILDRYLFRELTTNAAAVAIVLLVVTAGGTFARVLQQVAEGSYPAGVMFDVLGLKMLPALAAILPLALFLGILMALGRMYHDSEMHVLSASGMGARGVLKPVVLLGVPVAVVVAVVSLWLGPWASRTSNDLIVKANHSVLAAGLEAGRFVELPGNEGTLFVKSMSRDGTQLGGVMIVRADRGDKDSKPSMRVVTAAHGHLYTGTDGGTRYLALTDGWQYQVPLNADDWHQMRYERNDLAVSTPGAVAQSDADDIGSSTPTRVLMDATGPQVRAELAWRVAAPVATLVLIMLALPLSRQSPREPRYGRIMIAVLCYFVYFSLLSLARSVIGQGMIQSSLPIWVFHVLVAGISAWVFWRQYASRKTRGAAA